MTNINETDFIISTSLSSYNAKFIAPKWAPGFSCDPESCGLCCISELPEGVATKNFQPFNSMICKHYDVDKKNCNSYTRRPWGCKMFPFMYGIENGVLKISASLDCPATHKKELDISSIKNSFEDLELSKSFSGIELMYLRIKSSRAWQNSDVFWEHLALKIMDLFDLKSNFPLFYKAKSLIFNFIDEYYDVKPKREKFPPMDVILTSMLKSKSAIATDFQSNNPFHVRIKNGRAQVTVYNICSKKTEKIVFKLPNKPLRLSIDSDALELLKDYVELLMKRPFLSLSAASVIITGTRCNIPSMATSLLVGAFTNLEAGATFTALKNNSGNVDKNTMREIISFADGCLCGIFKNPSIATH